MQASHAVASGKPLELPVPLSVRLCEVQIMYGSQPPTYESLGNQLPGHQQPPNYQSIASQQQRPQVTISNAVAVSPVS